MKNRILQEKLKTMDGAELDRCYKECFESPAGQLVLEDLRNRCQAFVSSATGAWDRSGEIYFLEGMRAVVLTIESRIQPEPEDTVTP